MRRQGLFEFRTWGGKRRGAGRKRVAAQRRVAHRPREKVNAQHPLLVTTKVMPDVARLRTKVMFEFHARTLATPTAVKNAIRYVLCNARKHGALSAGERLDPFSSAFALPDWQTEASIRLSDITMQVALPRTWLLREGWRRAGTISPWQTPSAQEPTR